MTNHLGVVLLVAVATSSISAGSTMPRRQSNEVPKVEPFQFSPKQLVLGSSVRAHCQVNQGGPPLVLTFLHDGVRVVADDRKWFLSLFRDYSLSLAIEKVDLDDFGNYTCVAQNSWGVDSYTVNLSANIPPTWVREPSSSSAVKESTVSLDCAAKAFPRATTVWTNSDRDPPEVIHNDSRRRVWDNGTLTIHEVTVDDAGKYTCEVDNGVGPKLTATMTLKVHEPPLLITDFQTVTSKKGEMTKLKCRSKGETPMIVEWTKDGNHLNTPHGDRFETHEDQKPEYLTSELVVRDTNTEDAGIYKCKVKNKYGEASGTLQLSVLEPPEAPIDVKVIETASRFVRLAWRPPYSGNSPVIQYTVRYWTNDGKGRRLQETQVPVDSSALLKNLHPGVRYTVMVLAENSVGTGKPSDPLDFTTLEEEPSGSPTDVFVRVVDSNNLLVSWKPPPKDTWNGRLTMYQIGYRKHGTELAYKFENVRIVEGRLAEFTLTGLEPYTQYNVIVRASNNAGMGPWSPEITRRTSSGNPPLPPMLRVVSVNSHSLQLEWTHPVGPSSDSIKQFLLEYGKGGKLDHKVHIPGNKRQVLLRGLESKVRYDLHMAAYNEHGQSVFSPLISETTMELHHEAMTQESEATPFYLRLYFIVPVAVSVTVVVSTLVVAWACVARTRALEAASHLLREPPYDYKPPLLPQPQPQVQAQAMQMAREMPPPGVSLEEAYDVPWDMTMGDGNYTRLQNGEGRRSVQGRMDNRRSR